MQKKDTFATDDGRYLFLGMSFTVLLEIESANSKQLRELKKTYHENLIEGSII